MKKSCLIFATLVVFLGLTSRAVMAAELLRSIGPRELTTHTGPLPEGTTVQANEATGELQITFSVTGPHSFPLFEVPLTAIEDCVLEYRAEIRSQDLHGTACIEMLCEFAPGEQYFSRALDSYARGTTEFRACATLFSLQAGQRPQKVWLGVYAEGSGTVFLRNLSLWKGKAGLGMIMDPANPGLWWGIAGAAFGCVSGLWGAALGWLAWKGRARGFALGTTCCYMVFGLVCLAYACVVLVQGGDLWRVFPPLQLGGLAFLLGVFGYFMLRRRYQVVEEQRMAAIELSELHD